MGFFKNEFNPKFCTTTALAGCIVGAICIILEVVVFSIHQPYIGLLYLMIFPLGFFSTLASIIYGNVVLRYAKKEDIPMRFRKISIISIILGSIFLLWLILSLILRLSGVFGFII